MSPTPCGSLAPVAGNVTCNVAIIGGGLTGLSIAFHLKSHFRNWRVLVVEGTRIGHGASGKSGGVIVDHPDVPGSELDVRYLRELVALQSLRCEWRTRPDQPHQHLLNPFRLTNEFALLCRAVGVEIFENSMVTEIDSEGRRLVGESFNISSDLIFVATDAAYSLLGSLGNQLHCTVQNCIAVRVAKESSESLPWAYFSEINEEQYVWGRKIGPDVFLYGDEEKIVDASITSSTMATQDILASLGNELPFLRDCQVLRTWSGLISSFSNASRKIVQMDSAGGCFYIGGYNGYGIAAAVRSGLIVRSVIRGAEAPCDFPVTLWCNGGTKETVNPTFDRSKRRKYIWAQL